MTSLRKPVKVELLGQPGNDPAGNPSVADAKHKQGKRDANRRKRNRGRH